MSFSYGNKVKIQIFGQSHSDSIGVVIEGLPSNFFVDFEKVASFLQRRQGGKSHTTKRKENDFPKIVSGLSKEKTCGSPLVAIFSNDDINSDHYKDMSNTPRPSHVDYVAGIKYGESNDFRGGGHFSGRMTLPLCFAGAVCMQILEKENIKIGAHILSIGEVFDDEYSLEDILVSDLDVDIPILNQSLKSDFLNEINKYAMDNDSIGGSIECAITGLPIGIGEPIFCGIENQISSSIFAIPGIKGIEFGAGFEVATMSGSEHNDVYRYENGEVVFKSNNAGGILGGVSTSMPVIFRVAVKPTPTIGKPQDSIDLKNKRNITLNIEGRHDPCIVPRAVPCVEAATAIAIINLI